MLDAYADRWALVTGASSGIGEAFARRLAARGMHLVLTARRRESLEELAAELHTRHGARSEVIVGDLSEPDQPRRLFDEIARRQITIELLVNNAGFGVVGEPAAIDRERVMAMTRLNVGAVTELTYLFLDGMLERGHGAIVNLASLAGFQPVAYMAGYAATKAYVLHFSEALWAEVRDRGVTVMALCPGVTRTGFFDVAGAAGWLKKQRSQTPDQVVNTALKYLEKRRPYVVSGWWNHVLTIVERFATRRRVVLESTKYFRPKPTRPSDEPSPADTRPGETSGRDSQAGAA
ncbi:MAG TPA: SDR family oxidoreductase [Planctomycetaceae bacterium]|nr:SDR family oxidoreductase [Planctomycetaceae bacterium]